VTPDQVDRGEEEDLPRRVKREIAPASGPTIINVGLSAQAALRFPCRIWCAARRLPQPGHGTPRTVRKRQGG